MQLEKLRAIYICLSYATLDRELLWPSWLVIVVEIYKGFAMNQQYRKMAKMDEIFKHNIRAILPMSINFGVSNKPQSLHSTYTSSVLNLCVHTLSSSGVRNPVL